MYFLGAEEMNNSSDAYNILDTIPGEKTIAQCVLQLNDKAQVVLYCFVIVFGVFGNASICYFFGLFSKSASKGVSEVLILYLAVTDFCASIFSPFIGIYWIVTCRKVWHFGTVGCKLFPFLGRVFINMSVGIIVILALDRYRAICSPFNGQFKKKYIHASVIMTALLSILFEIFYLDALKWHEKPIRNGSIGCLVTPGDKPFYNRITTCILLTRDLFFVLVFSYTSIRIIFTLRKRNMYLKSPDRSSRHEMDRIIRVIIVMEIVFITLVLPRDLLHISLQVSWWDGDGFPVTSQLKSINAFLKVFQTANCCANVFIYAKMHARFRDKIVKLLRLFIWCAPSPLSETDTIQSELDSGSTTKLYTRTLLRESNRRQSNSRRKKTCDSSLIQWKSDASFYDNYLWENENL